MERVYYLCVDCCEARTSSFLPELLADRREVVVERSCCLLLGHCRTPKQKQTGLIPEKMIVTRTGSNPNELKEVATYLERGFLSYLLFLISVTINIFQQVKRRISSIKTTVHFPSKAQEEN